MFLSPYPVRGFFCCLGGIQKIYFYLDKAELSIKEYICIRKEARSLWNHNIFLLSDHDHDIIIDDNFMRYIIEYEKNVSYDYEGDSE